MRYRVRLAFFLLTVGLFFAQESAQASLLLPTDPSVSGGLLVWYRNPGQDYNPTTGVWRDSSGNGNDTSIVGSNAAPGLTNEVGITDGGLFDGASFAVVDSRAGAAQLIGTSSLAGGGFSQMTLIALVNYDGTAELNRPFGIGSNRNGTTPANLAPAVDGTVRRDNGFIPGAGPLNAGRYLVRATRLNGNGVSSAALKDFVFDNSGSGFQSTLNIDGSFGQISTGNTILRIGDIHSTDSTAGAVAQLALFSSALTDQQIEDIARFMVATPTGVPEPTTALTLLSLLVGTVFRRRRRFVGGSR